MKRAILLLVTLLAQPAFAADEAVNKVLDCMRANIPQTLRIQEFEITAVDRSKGERTLRGRLYGKNEKGLVRAMVKIMAPPDLANAAYLVREGKDRDEMYVYLPALNRVRRITGGSADGSLFGTDLSYNDIKQVQNAFSGGPIKLEKPEGIEGRPMHVMSMVPRADAQSRYNLVRAWVDQQTCVAIKMDFYENDTARKRLSASIKALKRAANHWYLEEAEMRDLKDNTYTTLKITGVSSGDKLADRYFNASTFYVGG